MGSGASTLPETLTAAEAEELFAGAFDAAKFAEMADPDTGTLSRERLLQEGMTMEAEGKALPDFFGTVGAESDDASQAEETAPDLRTEAEISDDEFEEELQSIASTRFKAEDTHAPTCKVRVHLYARNAEGNGNLGGEVRFCERSSVAGATLLPPSSVLSGTNHRLHPVPFSFEVRCGAQATFKWLACVAAQRYEAETLNVGTRRHREVQGSAQAGSRFMPYYVSTRADNDCFHAPDAKLFHAPPPPPPPQPSSSGGPSPLEPPPVASPVAASPGFSRSTSLVGSPGATATRPSSPQGIFRQGSSQHPFFSPEEGAPLRDGGEVWVTLGDRVVIDGSTVDNMHAPALTRWATMAFVHNRPWLVAAARAEEDALEAARKKRRATAAADLHRTRIMHKITAMKRVMGSFLEHDEEEVATKDHYFDMAGDTLSLLEPDPEMLDNVLEVLFENYSSIAEVFRIFATSPKGKTPCMSPSEFNNFVMQSKSLPPDKIWRITDIYNNSLIRPEGAANRSGKTKSASDKLKGDPNRAIITTTMDLAAFLVAMRNIAHARFLEGTGGASVDLNNEQIRELGKHKIKDSKDAVQVALHTAALAVIDKDAAMTIVDKVLGEDETLCIFYDRLAKLRGVFERYAGSDGVADTMTLNEFSALIRDASIMGMVEAKKVFNLVQKHEGEVDDDDDAVIRGLRKQAERKKRTKGGGLVELNQKKNAKKKKTKKEKRDKQDNNDADEGDSDLDEADEASLSALDKKVHKLADKVSTTDGAAYDDDSLMTFPEFLAGLARIGLWKFHGERNARMTTKVEKALDLVVDLWNKHFDAEINEQGDQVHGHRGDDFDHDTVSEMTASIIM